MPCPGEQAMPRRAVLAYDSAIARKVAIKERSWTGTKFAAQVPYRVCYGK